MSESMFAIPPFRLGGFATGNYFNVCHSCNNHFTGDKRAICCLPCEIKRVESMRARIDALTGGIEELLKALEKRQHLSVPPEAWPDIAPAANRLYNILEEEK